MSTAHIRFVAFLIVSKRDILFFDKSRVGDNNEEINFFQLEYVKLNNC